MALLRIRDRRLTGIVLSGSRPGGSVPVVLAWAVLSVVVTAPAAWLEVSRRLPGAMAIGAAPAVTAVGPRFDAVVHAPPRLQICGLLAAVDIMDFAAVRDAVGVSDSVLSKHVKHLEDAGYVQVRKATVASRQRTSLALTRAGRAAFAAHVAELRRITCG